MVTNIKTIDITIPSSEEIIGFLFLFNDSRTILFITDAIFIRLILLLPTFSIWQVGLYKAINFQVCTEPKRCILFLIYSF